MKISLSWLQTYLDLDLEPVRIAEILTEIGLEVEGYEEIEQIKGSLRGLIVGKVLTCVRHPNADRLSLTTVNIGSETLQIVCGAPNVAAGQKVVIATVGTILFAKDGKPWTINKGKIRGETSEGMICAEDEIGLGEDHNGILVLGEEFVVGDEVAKYFDTSKDVVFEIGLTPNRSDATSHMGVARDLLAALKVNHHYEGSIKWPDIRTWSVDDESLPIKAEVLQSEGCPRYAGVTISGIEIKESPAWLAKKLKSIGLRPINNVVDATNFVLHELGQPLHAFDYDKIGGQSIKVQTLAEGAVFTSLDEQERKLSAQDLMICDGNDHGMCIAGVFGGIGSGVTEGTKNIFLESAHFNAKWVRRTSGRHLLFTDAAKIFEKGSDPNICVYALKRAALLIKELAGGRISSEVIDIYPEPVMPKKVSLNYSHLNRLLGAKIDPQEVEQVLLALDMEVREKSETEISVLVPTNKVDVVRQADLIEEVLRIYGFNRIPDQDRMSFSVNRSGQLDEVRLRNLASDYLVAQGFYETMGLSMIDKKYLDSDIFHLPKEETVRINNTSNVQIEVMRPNLLITALETIRYNQNRQVNELRIFEFGKSYRYWQGGYEEKDHLVIAVSGWGSESWLMPNIPAKHEYYALKSIVENLLNLFGIRQWEERLIENTEWNFGLEYVVEGRTLGRFGRINDEICEYMDIRSAVFFADLYWAELLLSQKVDEVKVQELSRFPVVRRDLALVVDDSISFSAIENVTRGKLGAILKQINLFDVYRNEAVLGEGQKSYAISLLLSDSAKTFSDQEVDHLIKDLLNELATRVGARLR